LGGDFNNLEMAEKGPIDARFMLKRKAIVWHQMTLKNRLMDKDHHL
jgi:hypothetical protein